MKELLRSERHMYILEEGNCGALFLTVTCGGVGMYDLQIELNAFEKEHYRDQGEDYLNRLASQIGKDTSAFKDRAK